MSADKLAADRLFNVDINSRRTTRSAEINFRALKKPSRDEGCPQPARFTSSILKPSLKCAYLPMSPGPRRSFRNLPPRAEASTGEEPLRSHHQLGVDPIKSPCRLRRPLRIPRRRAAVRWPAGVGVGRKAEEWATAARASISDATSPRTRVVAESVDVDKANWNAHRRRCLRHAPRHGICSRRRLRTTAGVARTTSASPGAECRTR